MYGSEIRTVNKIRVTDLNNVEKNGENKCTEKKTNKRKY